MNFRQMEYIIEVDRCGSINKASQTLFVSQPALSSAIRDLENELGFSLFVRSSKGITTTPEGRQFIASAQQLLNQANQIRNKHVNKDGEYPPILKISSGRYSIVTKAAIEFYKQEFSEQHHFSFYLNESGNTDVVQDVFNRRADIGLIHIKNVEEESWKKSLESRGLEHIFLFSGRSCITLRRDHPLMKKKTLTPEDIYQYPQVRTISKNTEFCNYDTTTPFEIYDSFEKNFYTNTRGTLYDILSNTDAVFLGVTAQYITEFRPGLVTRPLPYEDEEWSVYYVKLKNVPLQLYAQKFIQIIQRLAEFSPETL